MLIRRNLMLFFRDKTNVFFSLMAVLIIIGLYVMFIGNIMEGALTAQLGIYSERTGVAVASLMLSGLVAITSVTSCIGAIGISIVDRERAAKDFFTSPVSRGRITFSYIVGSAGVGMIMTLVALTLCIVYIVSRGASVPGANEWGLLALTTVLSVACANALVFFMASFAQSTHAFSAMSSVVATLIGFLMGVYVPMGNMPETVQRVISIFPMAHAASMYRQILADGELYDLFTGVGASPEALQGFREFFGVIFRFGNLESTFWLSALWLLISTLIFFGLSLVFISKKKV